jgi:hypothetical protein
VADPITVVAVVAAFLVRFGLPLALTALAIWLLRRLDAHWQAEGTQGALVPLGPRCWEVHGCAPEKRAVCPAFLNSGIPCWQQFRDQQGNLRQSCLVCDFFRLVPPPAPAVVRS